MNKGLTTTLLAVAVLALGAGAASATAPCDDFGECKVLVEINSTDGDIGFHFLMDGDDLLAAEIRDPNNAKVFEDKAKGPLAEQFLTETFAESAEPLCWNDPEADEDEDIVTLEEFLDRWTAGTYRFTGRSEDGEMSHGETLLTFKLPAAPLAVDFSGGWISWMDGDDLGNCGSFAQLQALVNAGTLPMHPADVAIDTYEVVLEPDVEDDHPNDGHKYVVRVPGSTHGVAVPASYLSALQPDTPVKIEVGAITDDDNATFTEVDGFCANEDEGCEEEEEEE